MKVEMVMMVMVIDQLPASSVGGTRVTPAGMVHQQLGVRVDGGRVVQ